MKKQKTKDLDSQQRLPVRRKGMPDLMGKKILLADDEVNIRTSLTDILEECGYEVIHAANGQETMERVRRENPDLVLLDTIMPGIGGIEVCHQIKQVEKLPCKVIVYTGKIDAIDAVKAREAGADEYCIKGADPAILIEVVKKLICSE